MSEGESDVGGERGRAKRGALLEVNAHIREAAERLDAGELGVHWDFVCECGAPDCELQVRLTLRQFDALRTDGERILADGHPASRGASARQRAETLRDDAAALRAQAEHQTRRAARTRRPPKG